MSQELLFHAGEVEGAKHEWPRGRCKPRLLVANRVQRFMKVEDLDSVIPPNARARAFWAILERLDHSEFEAPIKVADGTKGRSAIDPKIQLCLWVYGMSEGVVHASELAELCEMHDAYRWIRGGVHVSARTLRDFRVDHGPALLRVFNELLVIMSGEGLLDLESIAQDGLRVRANAGAGSFHREPSLEKRLAAAKELTQELEKKRTDPDTGKRKREEVARKEREARQFAERIERALAEIPKVRAAQAASHKKKSERREPRASSTDPECRVMRMADGGFRPAYNVQVATETKARVIVGIGVTNVGGDSGFMQPMLALLENRLGTPPKTYFVDGGFVNAEAIDQAAAKGVTVYAPVPDPRDTSVDRHAPRLEDSVATNEWRCRMGTEEAKQRYKKRAEVAEGANADLRGLRRLDRLPVRGLTKVLCCGLLAALATNLVRYVSLLAMT